MIWTIAQREIVTRARSKGFRVITGILFVGVLAVALLQSVIGGDDEAREVTIGLHGDAVELAQSLEVGNDELAPTTVVVDEEGTDALTGGDVDVLFNGSTLTWEGRPELDLDSYVRSVAQQVAFEERAAALDLDGPDVALLFDEVEIDEVRLDGGDDDFGVRLIAAGAAGLATFMLLQIWGSFLMMGVIEEKASRVVEVLLSHVRPSTLLSGKILGLGVLAVGQMLIVVLGIVVGLMLVRDIDVPSAVWGSVPLFVATFLLGFGFYASAFAAAGSMVSRQEDAQSAQLPVMLPLFVGYFIAAASIGAPDNLMVTVGSFVPFTSPVLLPFRTAMVDPPLWQILLSLAILAASIVVMMQLAGRIYRYSLLRTGAKVSYTEAWRNRSRADIG